MIRFTQDGFRNPPKRVRPMVRWWWSGLDVHRDELLSEVRDMDEAGFGGAEVQAFMIGSPTNLAKIDRARYERSHRFMQPYYYEMVEAVLKEAASRDFTIDLTICSAWPAGGVHVTPEGSLKTLLMGTKVLRGPGVYRGALPRYDKPYSYRIPKQVPLLGAIETFDRTHIRLLRVVAAKPLGKPRRVRSFRPKTALLDIGTTRDITDCVSAEGQLEWEIPEGTWQVFAIYAGSAGTHPLFDARQEPDSTSYVLDHYCASAVEELLDLHLGRGKEHFGEHFGHTLRAFFTDSLELAAEWAWTDAFLAEFQRRRGYDPTAYLPVTYVPGRDNKYLTMVMRNHKPCFDFAGDLGERIRYDYERTISDLFTEEFVQAMTDWADANGLRSRIQAYGIRADTLKAYGIAHIPETEQLYAGGALDFLKLAGSAGLIYDKPLVTSETLVWMRRDYLTTPLKYRVAADKLFMAGINQLILHGYPYQNPAFAHPGFDPFSSPEMPMMSFASNMSSASPFRAFFPAINAYVTRLQYLMQCGPASANIGVYYPLFNYPDSVVREEELAGGYLDEHDAPKEGGLLKMGPPKRPDKEERWIAGQLRMGDHLMAQGYNYVHLNEERLLDASVSDGKLSIGAVRLDALILREIACLSVELAQQLVEIREAGIPILFVGAVPDRQPGFFNWQENDQVVESLMRDLATHFDCCVDGIETLVDRLRSLVVEPGLRFEEPQPTIQYIHRRSEDRDIYLLRNRVADASAAKMMFPLPGRVPILLDPWTGDAEAVPCYVNCDEGVELTMAFAPYESKVVLLEAAEQPLHAVQSDLDIGRRDGKLVARSGDAGSYSVELSDKSSRTIEMHQGAPRDIELPRWRLATSLRAENGTLRRVELDLDQLADWRDIQALAYCSSPGRYTCCIDLDDDHVQAGLRLTLDLGRVCDVAQVKVNGEPLPRALLVWPYRVDITDLVHAGSNDVEVVVTPTLRNRLVGYGKAKSKEWKQFRGKRALAPSGLLGPVRIRAEWEQVL